jgi:5-methylthioadenosine/S-adenosylhomocysteine deaminase
MSGTRRTVYSAQWVLPIATPPLREGAVVVEDTRIVWVGPVAALPDAFVHDPLIALGNAALLPGLVNTHTHLELTAMRGFLEGLAFREWLGVLTRARRDCFEPASLYDASCAGIEEALRNGITTCADTTESGTPLDAMRDMGIRGVGFIEVFGPNPSQCADSLSTLRASAEQQRQRDTALVHTGVSPHAPYTVSASLFTAVAEFAREGQWPVAVHIAESHAELQFVRDGSGPFADGLRARGIEVSPQHRSPIALLESCGVLDCQPLLIHAIQADDDDVKRIAHHGATVAHCPISNLKLGHGIAPLQRYRDANIAVGLGTDSVASNDRMDLLGEARQATLLHALSQRTPDALSATEALTMATAGGARALGMEHRIGTIETGKEADLVAFALDAPDARPVHDPAVTLVHVLAGATPAMLAVVAGRIRVRDGRVLDADPARQARMDALGERLRAWRASHVAGPVSSR